MNRILHTAILLEVSLAAGVFVFSLDETAKREDGQPS